MPPKRPVHKDKPRGLRLDEEGGETITVTVTVNGISKFMRSATISTGPENNKRYTLDNGGFIRVNRNQGYKEIAARMLLL